MQTTSPAEANDIHAAMREAVKTKEGFDAVVRAIERKLLAEEKRARKRTARLARALVAPGGTR